MRDIPYGRTLPDQLVLVAMFAAALILGAKWLA